MNWKRGLLRIWLVVSIPAAGYFGPSAYSNHQCALHAEALAAEWSKKVTEKRIATAENKPYLGAFNPQESFRDAAELRDSCADNAQLKAKIAIGVPVGLAVLMLAGWWITAGFRK